MNLQARTEETSPALRASPRRRLVLTWGAHRVDVTGRHPTLTVGRGVLNDIVIANDKVSRYHARIDCGASDFSLTDRSANGTFITDAAGRPRMVRNETHLLRGAGTLSFGIDPANGPTHLVKYDVSP